MIAQNLIETYQQHVTSQLERYRVLLSQHRFDGVLISAGTEQKIYSDDSSYPFKVNPYFKAWLPLLDRPGSALWIDVNAERPVLFYHQPVDIWHQISTLQDETILSAFAVVTIEAVEDIQRHLPLSQRIAFLGQSRECCFDQAVINPQVLVRELDYQRAYKSDYEIGCIRLASQKAVAGHRAAESAFRQGESEYAIHMAYLSATGQLEEELPYNNIIAINEHASVLHYTQKKRQNSAQRHSFLIDAGASVAGYAADISRTYAFERGLFDDLVASMDGLQRQIIASIELGQSYIDLHLRAHQRIAQLLYAFDLVKVMPDECLQRGLTSLFFPHGLGHLLGLQVHDSGGWQQNPEGDLLPPPGGHPYLRLTRPIEAGQVFTVEPGLYFIPALLNPERHSELGAMINWPLVDELIPFGGIRIEDNIHMLPSGPVNLTRTAFAR